MKYLCQGRISYYHRLSIPANGEISNRHKPMASPNSMVWEQPDRDLSLLSDLANLMISNHASVFSSVVFLWSKQPSAPIAVPSSTVEVIAEFVLLDLPFFQGHRTATKAGSVLCKASSFCPPSAGEKFFRLVCTLTSSWCGLFPASSSCSLNPLDIPS